MKVISGALHVLLLGLAMMALAVAITGIAGLCMAQVVIECVSALTSSLASN